MRAFTFYQEGCLAWFSTVAVADVIAPPRIVADRDLSKIHTKPGKSSLRFRFKRLLPRLQLFKIFFKCDITAKQSVGGGPSQVD